MVKVSPKKPTVNNFIKKNESVTIDKISKIYITIECLLGLNHVGVLDTKLACKLFVTVYAVFINFVVIYLVTIDNKVRGFPLVMVSVKVVQYVAWVLLSSSLWKRTWIFYKELDKFDDEIGCKPHTTTTSKLVLFSMGILILFASSMNIYMRLCLYLPLHLVYMIEAHYFSHLSTLISARVQLMNFYLESSLSDGKNSVSAINKGFHFTKKQFSGRLKVKQLLDLYDVIINAHDYLVDAVKWQAVVILLTTFIFILADIYYVTATIIKNSLTVIDMLLHVSMVFCEFASLFPPCLCCDQVRSGVRRFRELLASTLYEGKLDKRERSAARGILALTETHNLSFSLLRMVDISVSLPFSFIGLIFTYLIIMLQFQKIISPND